jgi:hypothetical protein
VTDGCDWISCGTNLDDELANFTSFEIPNQEVNRTSFVVYTTQNLSLVFQDPQEIFNLSTFRIANLMVYILADTELQLIGTDYSRLEACVPSSATKQALKDKPTCRVASSCADQNHLLTRGAAIGASSAIAGGAAGGAGAVVVFGLLCYRRKKNHDLRNPELHQTSDAASVHEFQRPRGGTEIEMQNPVFEGSLA